MTKNDMRVCGNCFYRKSVPLATITEEQCTHTENVTSSCDVCDEWKWDGMSAEDRMVKR